MKWCNPCALMWVFILSAWASNVWLHWTYSIVAAVVLLPGIVVYIHREREDIYFTLQGILNEIWWMLKNRSGQEPKRRVAALKAEQE